jgi:hypothetical protein
MTSDPPLPAVSHRRLEFVAYMALALALSLTPYVHRPLGWFETLFHESSHGLAAVLTGGSAQRLELAFDGSGLMWTAGGVRPVVAFAGYAGAIMWGALVYLASSAASPRTARAIGVFLLGAGCLEALCWLAWSPVSLGIDAFILGTLSTMLWRRTAAVSRPLLRLVGAYVLVSGMRSPTYVLEAGGAHNDASTLSGLLLLPEWMWVCAWCALGVVAIVVVYRTERGADRAHA